MNKQRTFGMLLPNELGRRDQWRNSYGLRVANPQASWLRGHPSLHITALSKLGCAWNNPTRGIYPLWATGTLAQSYATGRDDILLLKKERKKRDKKKKRKRKERRKKKKKKKLIYLKSQILSQMILHSIATR